MRGPALVLATLSLVLKLSAVAAATPDEEWLAENAKKPGVFSTASGVQYKVLTSGKGARSPSFADECICHFTGTLLDGQQFDASPAGSPGALSPGETVRGLAEALQMMREGDKWEVLVPPALGFGDFGGIAGSPVKPGAALMYTVELIAVRRAAFQWKVEHFVALGIGVILAIAGVRQALQKRAIPLGKCVGAEGNKFVFLEVAIDGRPAGRIEIELFSWVAPRAVENFRCLCTGEKGGSKNWPGRKLHFKGTRFHRIIPGFMMQGGDITGKDGLGAESVYGGPFEDEWQHGMVKHTERGLLSMANAGPDTNGSQFFITSWRCNWIDGKHVCFGRVLNAMQSKALDRIEDCGVMDEDKPVEKQVVITDCGEFDPSDKKAD